MSVLNRQTSKSTEFLHVSNQVAPGGARRSWDSLVTEKNSTTGSTEGFNHEKLNRARFSVCSSGPSLTPPASGNMPWFGGSLGGGDQSPRILGTMPRNIVALLDRPVTYEEELEDRMGHLRVNAATLRQRLASEKKKTLDLTQQLNAREMSYRGAIEKLREQYDQRFERLKNRARVLVTRCEFLRNEKQLIEQRLTQVIDTNARDRQGMERKISGLQEEIEMLKRNDRVTSVADDDLEVGALPVLRVTEEDDDLEKEKEKVKKDSMINDGSTGRRSVHFKLLCEIAVARAAFLEHWITDPNSVPWKTKEQHYDTLHSLSRRSSSCPMIAVSSPLHLSDNESFQSSGNHLEEPQQTTQHVTESEGKNLCDDSRVLDQTILRLKSYPPTSGVPSARTLGHTHSMAPTIGQTIPILPSTIRISLQKLFHAGKSNPNEVSYSLQNARTSLSGRIETNSDEEFSRDISIFDAKSKRTRPQSSKGGKCSTLPTSAKRHSSLPRTELFRKFQHGGKHDKESQSLNFHRNFKCVSQPHNNSNNNNNSPLTKQERVLGIRLDRVSDDNMRFTSSDHPGELPVTRLHSQTHTKSTESLPDQVELMEGNSKTMKRNRSLHSTFGRLHQRRNGVANIEPIEQKTPNKSGSTFDSFGKNLKHYLH